MRVLASLALVLLVFFSSAQPAFSKPNCGNCPPSYCTDPAYAARLKAEKKRFAEARGLPARLSAMFDQLDNCEACIKRAPARPSISWNMDRKAYKAKFGEDPGYSSISRPWNADTELRLREELKSGLITSFHIYLGEHTCKCCPEGADKETYTQWEGEVITSESSDSYNEGKGFDDKSPQENFDNAGDVAETPKDLTEVSEGKRRPQSLQDPGVQMADALRLVHVVCPECEPLAEQYNDLVNKINNLRRPIAQGKRNLSLAAQTVGNVWTDMYHHDKLAHTPETAKKKDELLNELGQRQSDYQDTKAKLDAALKQDKELRDELKEVMEAIQECEKNKCKKQVEEPATAVKAGEDTNESRSEPPTFPGTQFNEEEYHFGEEPPSILDEIDDDPDLAAPDASAPPSGSGTVPGGQSGETAPVARCPACMELQKELESWQDRLNEDRAYLELVQKQVTSYALSDNAVDWDNWQEVVERYRHKIADYEGRIETLQSQLDECERRECPPEFPVGTAGSPAPAAPAPEEPLDILDEIAGDPDPAAPDASTSPASAPDSSDPSFIRGQMSVALQTCNSERFEELKRRLIATLDRLWVLSVTADEFYRGRIQRERELAQAASMPVPCPPESGATVVPGQAITPGTTGSVGTGGSATLPPSGDYLDDMAPLWAELDAAIATCDRPAFQAAKNRLLEAIGQLLTRFRENIHFLKERRRIEETQFPRPCPPEPTVSERNASTAVTVNEYGSSKTTTAPPAAHCPACADLQKWLAAAQAELDQTRQELALARNFKDQQMRDDVSRLSSQEIRIDAKVQDLQRQLNDCERRACAPQPGGQIGVPYGKRSYYQIELVNNITGNNPFYPSDPLVGTVTTGSGTPAPQPDPTPQPEPAPQPDPTPQPEPAPAGCTGPQPPPGSQLLFCPEGQTGSITQERTYSCLGNEWAPGDWQNTSNTCAAPPPPPPPPTGCVTAFSSGNYGCSGACGLSSVGLAVTPGSNAMTANPFGDNSSAQFSCSGSSAASQSSNLFILGAPGHTCTLSGTGSATAFGILCQNSGGGSCNSSCSR